MTTNETAKFLNIDPAVVRQQIAAGKIRATKKGRDWNITPAAAREYDAARTAYFDRAVVTKRGKQVGTVTVE